MHQKSVRKMLPPTVEMALCQFSILVELLVGQCCNKYEIEFLVVVKALDFKIAKEILAAVRNKWRNHKTIKMLIKISKMKILF